MASLSTDAAGNRTIQFVGGDGKRRSIRLGKVPKKLAEGVRMKVEALDAAQRSRLPLDPDTASWVGGIGDELHAKLARAGLVTERRSETLGEFLAAYIARRLVDSKPSTVDNLRYAAADLT